MSRFTLDFRRRFPGNLSREYHAFAQTINPNPFGRGKRFYWYAWTSEQRKALEHLKACTTNAINQGNEVTIKCKSIAGKRDFLPRRVQVQFQLTDSYQGWDYPDVEFDDTAITDNKLRMDLLAWVTRVKYHQHIASLISKYASTVVHPDSGVNTPGQLFRVWPQAAQFALPKYRDRMASQKLKSSLPEHWQGEELEGFQSAPYMDKINEALLAMIVMDGYEEDHNYPRVY